MFMYMHTESVYNTVRVRVKASYFEPLVNALGVELMSTRQDTDQLMSVKVIHADDTQSLCVALGVLTEAV